MQVILNSTSSAWKKRAVFFSFIPKLPECTACNALQGHTNSFLVGIVLSFNNYCSETVLWLKTNHYQDDIRFLIRTKIWTTIYKNKAVWLAFPIHLEYSEVRLQHPSVYMGPKAMTLCYTHCPFLGSLSSLFEKKLAWLKFTVAQGINFSFCSWRMHTSTPPAHSSSNRLLILADRMGSILACSSWICRLLYALQVLPKISSRVCVSLHVFYSTWTQTNCE